VLILGLLVGVVNHFIYSRATVLRCDGVVVSMSDYSQSVGRSCRAESLIQSLDYALCGVVSLVTNMKLLSTLSLPTLYLGVEVVTSKP